MTTKSRALLSSPTQEYGAPYQKAPTPLSSSNRRTDTPPLLIHCIEQVDSSRVSFSASAHCPPQKVIGMITRIKACSSVKIACSISSSSPFLRYMMLVRASTLFTIALAAIAIATPTEYHGHHEPSGDYDIHTRGDASGYCNTGDLKCCNVYQEVRPWNLSASCLWLTPSSLRTPKKHIFLVCWTFPLNSSLATSALVASLSTSSLVFSTL